MKRIFSEVHYYERIRLNDDLIEVSKQSSTISIQEQDNEFYDIHVKTEGSEGNKKIYKNELFKFDTKKYKYLKVK